MIYIFQALYEDETSKNFKIHLGPSQNIRDAWVLVSRVASEEEASLIGLIKLTVDESGESEDGNKTDAV